MEESTKAPCSRPKIILNVCLNFNLSFENGGGHGREGMGKSQNVPLLSRFLSTAVLASVLGGLLLSFEWIYAAGPPMVQATPASLEMMRVLRDEHSLMANIVRAQLSTDRRN